ncbi:MAG: HAD family phosphatase [Pseudomonadota bacterium]
MPEANENTSPLVVLLDAMGVLYQAGDDVAELLVPFIAARCPRATPAEVEARYLEASLGRLDADAFWAGFALPPEAEDDYLLGHRLHPGVHDFLDWARGKGIAVACLSNDVGRWSRKLRRGFGLEDRFAHWVISGDVSLRKPDPAIYQRFLERAGVAPEQVLFVDDRARNVEAARALGLHAVLFGAGSPPPDAGHARDFAAVRRCATNLLHGEGVPFDVYG